MKILDGINPSVLRAVWATWPGTDWRGWHHYSGPDSEKWGTRGPHVTPAASEAIRQMIDRIGDYVEHQAFPDLELHGAGMHMIRSGGYLRPHLDSSIMEATGWRREYSCVLCVNPEWQDDWGGEFVLHETGESHFPKFNHLMMFETTETALHEVKQVNAPVPRCTLSVFFWSLRKPADETRKTARFTR
jgi:Rps23 Pro-64 3,4-dihydroxylase Tpa1-like proline 4-hydroxylase